MTKEALKCQSCGSPNLERYDGFFICENCGTKYTDEQYQKLVIEQNVKISHTHTYDNSGAYHTAIKNARRCFKNGDWNGVREYYHQATSVNSGSLEALLYEPFAKVILTDGSSDMSLRDMSLRIFKNSISAVSELWKGTPEDEELIKTFAKNLEIFRRHKFFQYGKQDRHGIRKEFYKPLYQPFADIIAEFIRELDEIASKEFNETLNRLLVSEINLLFNIKKAKFNTKFHNKLLEKAHARLKENIPEYVIPEKIKRYSRRQVSRNAKLITLGVIILLIVLYNLIGSIPVSVFS
ncbi:MAG: TFIIB-type zinc ribbon-containing protein [Ruminococcus sp.]|jgi:uncharacterized Zn finger protein (UPF0148 family)|nr:TFIIB-type zinc ribbon-containing protein [Ruminococcus sp.]